jgi:hypothetical protein
VRTLNSAVLMAALLLFALPDAAALTLISTNADWKLHLGATEASSPDRTSWRNQSFDDSTWPVLPATFYYGETNFLGTRLTNMQGAYTTIFLRKDFYLGDPTTMTNFFLNAVCDDGFVACVNGTPVVLYSPPTNALNEITITSVASTNAAEPVRFIAHPLPMPASYLQAGPNVLAVQVFNLSLGSSDLVFDAELTAETVPGTELRVATVSPMPGRLFTSLTQITVTFSEPVTGVVAAAMLVNDVGATNVTGGGATYAFEFPQPPFGTVSIDWDVLQHPIAAAADPARTLSLSTPDVVWAYELVSPEAPRLSATQPQASAVVRVLQQTEVWFDKTVIGVDAADLLVNGQPAINVAGIGAGPYRFQFAAPAAGSVTFRWRTGHGITDDTPLFLPFPGATWQCTLDPQRSWGDIVINEFLAENVNLPPMDQDGDYVGWIELFNRGAQTVDLGGWSLTDDPEDPGKWVFPSYLLPASGYLTVFASGKDQRIPGPGRWLHTNFKLSANGEYLGLYTPDAPRQMVQEFSPQFPEQRPNYSYGRTPSGDWRYYATPTLDRANGSSTISNTVEAVHFSVERGFYSTPFRLSLACDTPGVTIRYTTNSSPPAGTNGFLYTEPILINTSRVIRATAFRTNQLPSLIRTHTYLYNLPANRRQLPVLSLVTASNNLYGASGIMEYSPRNTTKQGIAWERPVSAELIRPEDNGGFQEDCGIRVAGGDYVRGQYNYRGSLPFSKYSFRLYFRGDYGAGHLCYPLFPGTTVDAFDTVHLRAGMNDHSNPFIRDELARQLESDVGVVASHGTFVNLFLNGTYKGIYNPAERIDPDFLRTYHKGGENWDVIAQMGEVNEGDTTAWTALKNFANSPNLTNAATSAAAYLELGRMMDLTNFVDYLLPLIYADTDDWPHNNWRAARERVTNGVFRFYAWDAEWSFGFNGVPPSHNTIAGQLSSTSPPWGTAEIQTIFNKLKRLPEFKLLFADRVHKHLFNGGALTDERIRQRYEAMKTVVVTTITGFINTIGSSWIPSRRRYLLQHLAGAGFMGSSNAPVFNPFGGRVGAGALLTMSCTNGTIYYTTNETDPRVMFASAVAPDAQTYTAPLPFTAYVVVKARTLYGTNWSALTEAAFTVEALGVPLRITELMYNPPGGDAYEFIELQNVGLFPVPLQDFSFTGIGFRFPVGSLVLAPGARLVVASAKDPAAFAARYPGLAVAGYFGGSLSNGGERITLLDPTGRVVCAVDYDDDPPWPMAADGGGASLEVIDPWGDLDDPANWQGGGSPGEANGVVVPPEVRLSEVMAFNLSAVTNGSTCPDWVELHNAGASSVDLPGWSLSDGGNPRSFVFPAGTTIPAGGYQVVWCDGETNAPGLHTRFALDADGEMVALYDAATSRVDVITFGPQVANLTVGRVGGAGTWQLCEPTLNAPNEPAQLGTQAGLVVNEFLANPVAGQDDWLELHNRDLIHAAPLRGLYFSVSNALCQLPALGFVAPGGYVQLRADEQPGPNHLELKLPAGGGTLVLSDATGAELDRVTYGSQVEGVSMGRLPNGTGLLTGFPGTASPGAANYRVLWMGPVLNEVMARNVGAVTNAAGRVCDWLELFNPLGTDVDFSGHSLSVGRAEPGEWVFPAGTVIPHNGYLVVGCDGTQPPSTNAGPALNLGRSLAGEGEVIHLFNPAGQVVDSVAFGFQLVDASIGRTAEGWRLLSAPTPGDSNAAPAALASAAGVRINEWLADAGDQDDWFELYNPAALPVDLGGLFLTDDPSLSGQTSFLIGPLTFIPAGGFVKWTADGQPDNGRDHVNFSLDERGESLRLNASVSSVIDGVDFEFLPPGVSAGRWPDGETNFVWFYETATPGESNYLPLPAVVLHEILTHTDPPLEDAIEAHNRSGEAVDVGGWFLSNSADALRRCRIPTNTVVPAGGYVVLYENLFNPAPGTPASFELNSAHGGKLYLSEADRAGNLTGFRSVVEYGAAANGVSFGRVATSVGVDIAPLSVRTFGVDLPATVEQFRTGAGLANAVPRVGPVVISELMYHPVSGPTNNLSENPDEEYVELHNATTNAVPLFDPAQVTNTWRIIGGVNYGFAMGTTLGAGETVLVVGFDPELAADTAAAFRARHGLSGAVRLFGPYDGQLSNRGEAIELLRPDKPEPPGGPDAGYVPYLRVDYVRYGTRAPWPIEADGTGWSLQRRRPLAYGNEPLHWKAGAPTPGVVVVAAADLDTDGDGMPDMWEDANLLSRGNATDATQDADGDGLTNLEEYLAGTDPHRADTDGDGMSDAWERANWLDPRDPLDGAQDPDRDGLSNLRESVAGTQPRNPDTDGDTFPDGWEVASQLDPLQPDDPQADPDGDGMTNIEEYVAGTAPLDPDSNLSLTLTLTDTECVLHFIAQPNRRYNLEYRDDLEGLVWSLWTTFPATPIAHDNELRWSRVGQSGSRYFRVVMPAQP